MYSISIDGLTLDLQDETYQRTGGTGSSLEGLWLNTAGTDERRFRSDGTDTIHEFGGDSYEGIYEDHGTSITRLEKRAFVIADGPMLIFQPLTVRWVPGAYTVSGDELTLFFASGILVWTRV